MICRRSNTPLHSHAVNILTSAKFIAYSWFQQIRNLCIQYDLPHPIELLQSPPSKYSYKTYVKKKVMSFWEIKLRDEAAQLSSLDYFHPEYYSLTRPHPLWTTAGSSPYHVSQARVQASMLSGQYPTERRCRFWSGNTNGYCLLPGCLDNENCEDLKHILAICPSLSHVRDRLNLFTLKSKEDCPVISDILGKYCDTSHENFIQFLIDCSTLPEVISLRQSEGPQVLSDLFKVTRTWCYSLH